MVHEELVVSQLSRLPQAGVVSLIAMMDKIALWLIGFGWLLKLEFVLKEE